jgi:hypothetical protein
LGGAALATILGAIFGFGGDLAADFDVALGFVFVTIDISQSEIAISPSSV